MKPQLFFALAGGLSAQVPQWSCLAQGETYQAIRRSGQATGKPRPWNGWQPGQSAAIGPESSGYPAKLGAPAERVEASRKFAQVFTTTHHEGGLKPDAVNVKGIAQKAGGVSSITAAGHAVGILRSGFDRPCRVGIDCPVRLLADRSQPVAAGLKEVDHGSQQAPALQVIDIPPTANGPVGAERSGMLLGECRGTEPRTERQRPAIEPVKEQKRHTANCHRSTCWPERRADTDARDLVRRGSGSSAIPSAGIQIRAGWWRAHLADSGIHLAATSLDMASSWGRPELNPLLRSADGRFGARGLTVKLAVFGGVEVIKWRIARRHGKFARVLSLAPAGAYGTVAARNWRAR